MSTSSAAKVFLHSHLTCTISFPIVAEIRIDFVAKPHDWVGGFSLASSPRELPKITIAVKYSSHLPATWVHDDKLCTVGRQVEIRVGGDCILDEDLPLRPSVFCAGGIGVSPILSQYREFIFLRDKNNSLSINNEIPKTMFLYSASSDRELVFADCLAELSRQGSEQGHDRMVFAITKK